MSLKYVALVALVVQNSGLAVLMRYTFLIATEHHERYITSTAVLLAELFKCIISLVACFLFDCDRSFSALGIMLYHEFVVNKIDLFKLMIPSLLYTVQNSLQYFSMQCLSAPVFQVLYQMKIITTAMFSVLLLAKDLTSIQWISIVFLTVGVALVQLSQTDFGASASPTPSSHSGSILTSNSIAGLISVLCGCLTSGFAGVYFEKVLKTSKASIWLRNIQLSFIGIIMSTISCRLRDSVEIHDRGFFAGYNSWVWSVISLQTIGGLLVAIVVKYADNVLKGFATSISIVLSSVISMMYFHDINVNISYLIGSLVVLVSVYLYGYSPAGPQHTTTSGQKKDLISA